MRYINVRFLLLISLFSLFTFSYFRPTNAMSYSKIEFVSSTDWDATVSDPNVGVPAAYGKAQMVCLNHQAPASCPDGATLYGYANSGWSADLTPIPGAKWIWAPGVISTTSPADSQEYYFFKVINLPEPATQGSISIAADDFAEVRVNGGVAGIIGSTTNLTTSIQAQDTLATFDITKYLVRGENLISIRVKSGPREFGGCSNGCTYAANPAGLVFGGFILYDSPLALDESAEPSRIFLPQISR
ncbi:MAG: hypothetical protein U0175_30800 [Caldilineaceae bacterium]